MSTVEAWFGEQFGTLHPQLQSLHRHGGTLHGTVRVEFGSGAAGWMGRRLARGLGVPEDAGEHELQVFIRSDDGVLHWDRCFDERTLFRSTFTPVGRFPDGYWVERSGKLQLLLTVDVVGGGWHWRQLATRMGAFPLPRWLMPRTRAHKEVVDGLYAFDVAIDLPLAGRALRYHGRLALRPDTAPAATIVGAQASGEELPARHGQRMPER